MAKLSTMLELYAPGLFADPAFAAWVNEWAGLGLATWHCRSDEPDEPGETSDVFVMFDHGEGDSHPDGEGGMPHHAWNLIAAKVEEYGLDRCLVRLINCEGRPTDIVAAPDRADVPVTVASRGSGYRYAAADGAPLAVCPACGNDLTGRAGVLVELSVAGRSVTADSYLDGNGVLADTADGAVAAGFHGATLCGKCGDSLADFERPTGRVPPRRPTGESPGPAFFNASPPVARVGDRVRYDDLGTAREGVATGFGEYHGARIVLLADGSWCYAHHLVSVPA